MTDLTTKIIFNADDFGYCNSVNYAILDCFKAGLLKSTTLMANMPGFNQAVQIAKANPALGVGVHLTLTCGTPLTDVPTLIVPETGKFKRISFYNHGDFTVSEDEIYQELKGQIEKVIATGIYPTHFDSHQHIHTMGSVVPIVEELASEYRVPIRNHDSVRGTHFVTSGFTMVMDDYSMRITPDSYESLRDQFVHDLVEEATQYNTFEVMTHPGYLEYFVFQNSSFTTPRAIDAAFLQDPIVINAIKNSDFEITDFKNIGGSHHE
ncbi:carbohydrate deacetylase [Lapidilactobacillus achengensis]|uniref:Carbohydrate deacetylase n=1 Tax=Lapidilactobacillus achengensis TaxID=2486000 RepID=A0ABW1URA1_9LACO|nr:carbohydrate deacetylase [Lapidilactobacillus achengensis]